MDIPNADGPPSANRAQVYRALLHKPVEPIEKWGDPPLLINPTCAESYYTKPVEPIKKYAYIQCRWTPNWAQVYRALLHQTSITYWEMRRCSPLIDPKCTEAYYTKQL